MLKTCVGDHHCSGNCSNTPKLPIIGIFQKESKGSSLHICHIRAHGVLSAHPACPAAWVQILVLPDITCKAEGSPQLHLHQQVMMGDLPPRAMEVVTEAASCLFSRLGEPPDQ